MRWLLAFFFLQVSPSIFCHNLRIVEEFNQIPKRILKQFPEYSVVVHYENKTASDLGIIFPPPRPEHQAFYLYNYDVEKATVRVLGYKFLNVVFLEDPFGFETFCSVDYNFMPLDFVVVIVRKYRGADHKHEHVRLKKIWHMFGLHWAATVMLFDLSTSRLFNCCYYCGESTGVMKKIASGDKLPNLRRNLNTFSDFRGHVFKIAYANFPPFFSCRNGSNPCDPEGAEGVILKLFSQKFNFKYDLVQYQSELNPRGQWRAMVEGVHFRKVDWAVGGISVSAERGVSTDFTRYFKTQGFSLLYATYDQVWVSVQDILFVFKWIVWVVIVITVICIAIFTTFGVKILQIDEIKFFGFLKIAMMSIVEQATPLGWLAKPFASTSIKSTLLIWWLMALILTTMYKSQLASTLISPNYQEPGDIEGLVSRGFKFQANKEDWSVLRENLVSASDEVYSTVLETVNDDLEFCDAVKAVVGGKVAVIDEESPIQYDVFKKCSQNLTHEEFSRLRLASENMFPSAYHAWCMQTSTPYRIRFSRTIGRLDDSGLMQHWYQAAFAFKLPKSNQDNDSSKTGSLNLTQIIPALLLLGIGLAASFAIFLYEYCFHHNCARFRQTKI